MDNNTELKLHRHCELCIKVSKCTKKPEDGESCLLVNCQKKCGATYHACKEDEHFLLCPNVKVPCINSGFGCPHIMMRKYCGPHLESCPASCIPCNAEWNRWPLCSKERQIHIPFAQINPQLKEEQLDVALALRDQEMLDHWMQLPRKIQQLMRSALTPRHPPIPLVSSLWNPFSKKKFKSISSDDGLLNQSTESTPRQSAERSDASLLSMTSTDDESPWGRRRKPPGLQSVLCAQLFNSKAQPNLPLQHQEINVKATVIEEDDTLSDISNDLDDSAETTDFAFIAPTGANGCGQLCTEPPPGLPLLTTLGLDLSIECMPGYLGKPKSMYTFVCALDFRRDEYPWHYRNWHSDIHGGLDGWIEQRCPLARYGCSFARRRLCPGVGSRVIYSSSVKSFGVLAPSTSIYQNTESNSSLVGCNLGDLPFELLRSIAGYLDSFSLCHLAMTSQLFRDVARSLLPNRGIVSMQWQKTRNGWRVSHNRWIFSTSFSPVERWNFEEGEHISNHLKNCRYNIKSSHVFPDRIALPGCDPDAKIISSTGSSHLGQYSRPEFIRPLPI